MNRSVRGCVVFVLTAGLAVATITGAQASVAAKSAKKFCEKALEISTTVPDLSGGDDALIDAAEDFAKEYKKLAKRAPTGELRKAAKTISKYYERLADTGDPNSEEATYTDKEIDAITTMTEFNVAKCADLGVTPET